MQRPNSFLRTAICLIWAVFTGVIHAEDKAGSKPETEKTPVDLSALIGEFVKLMGENGIEFDSETMKTRVLEAAVQALKPQGYLVSGERFEALESQSSGAIHTPGFQVGRYEGRYRITKIFDDGPAGKADIEVKDYLLGVNGESVDDLSVSEIVAKLRGTDEKPVKVRVRKSNGQQKDLEVPRKKINLPTIYSAETLPSSLCYLRLNGIYEKSGDEVAGEIKSWTGETRFGLVLDLRGAGGTNIHGVVEVVSEFTEKDKKLFTFKDKEDGVEEVYNAEGGGPGSMPVMVLIDKWTTGAAELLAATLKGSVRGVLLLGEPTEGRLLVREKVTLSTGDRIYLPTRRLEVAKGSIYDGSRGVMPNVIVDDFELKAREYIRANNDRDLQEQDAVDNEQLRNRVLGDPVLKRAVDVLLGLKALNITTRADSSR